MRKVKFRAQEASSKEWIYGAYHSSTPDKLFATYPHDLPVETIIPETVGEFAEMFDTNGKSIWEDDILENQRTDVMCKYKRGRVGRRNGKWILNYSDSGFVELWWALEIGGLVVIGNAHDNLDLLEG